MFKFLSRFATIYLMRRWLKPRWRLLATTVVGILLINYLHSEYLVYVEVSENTEYLVLSYVAKFTLIIAILVGCNIGLRAKSSENRATHAFTDEGCDSPARTSDDGFDFLREKKRLDSRASKIIKK